VDDHQIDPPIIAELKNIESAVAGRRFWSWILFVSILCVGLILPLVANVIGDSSSQLLEKRAKLEITKQASPTLFALDKIWNSGTMSNAHKEWANDCKVCHRNGFESVKDVDCLSCHQTVNQHVSGQHHGMGDLKVSCGSCHQEHNGTYSLAEQNRHYTQTNCAGCHQNLKESLKETQLQNVSDFAKNHPNFKVQVADNTMPKGKFKYLRMDDNGAISETEKSGLKFPHDVHLTKDGVNSPQGKVKVGCSNCHEDTPDGASFKPVEFTKNCQSCHALKFEPSLFNREVPHGPVDAVLSTLREFYSYTKLYGLPQKVETLTPNILIGRPGETNNSVVSFARAGGDDKAQAAAAATELFEKTSCIVCHDVKRIGSPGKEGTSGRDLPQWSIAPVVAQHAWMPKANFNHAAHSVSSCTTCHAAKKSKSADDILMPTIKVCKDCHAGSAPPAQRVKSDCGLCHNFHMKTEQLWKDKKKDVPKSQSELGTGLSLSTIRVH